MFELCQKQVLLYIVLIADIGFFVRKKIKYFVIITMFIIACNFAIIIMKDILDIAE